MEQEEVKPTENRTTELWREMQRGCCLAAGATIGFLTIMLPTLLFIYRMFW